LLQVTAFFGALVLGSVEILPGAGERLPLALDLDTAMLLAVRHSPTIREARARIQEQEGVLTVAKADRLPRLDGVANYDANGRGRIEGFGNIVVADQQGWNLDVQLSHVLYSGGARTANHASAKARVAAAESQMRVAIDGLLLETSGFYFDGLLARQRIEVQEEAVQVLEGQLETAKAGFEAGTRPQFDVLQAEVALANAKPPLIRARNEYRLAIDRLRRSIGLPYAEGCDAGQVKLSQSWPNPRVNESLGDLLLQGLAKRPELAALASEIQAAKSAVGVAKAVHRPRVELFGTYGAQSLRFSGNASDLINGTTGGVRVVVPLVDLGRTRGQVEQANARLQQIQAREDQQRLDIEGQVRQAFFDYDEASQILDTSQLVVKQANEALRLAQNRFEAGALTQLEILQSRLELTRAQLEEVQSLHTYNLAVARLRQAVGSIARESAAAPVLP
jgi:outer membrane protein TolC